MTSLARKWVEGKQAQCREMCAAFAQSPDYVETSESEGRLAGKQKGTGRRRQGKERTMGLSTRDRMHLECHNHFVQ